MTKVYDIIDLNTNEKERLNKGELVKNGQKVSSDRLYRERVADKIDVSLDPKSVPYALGVTCATEG